MRVEYEGTMDEFLDAHERALAHSKVAQSWRNKARAWAVLINAGLSFAITTGLLILLGQLSVIGIVGISLGAAFIAGFFAYESYLKNYRKEIYKYVREQFGARETAAFALEITAQGLKYKHLGVESCCAWAVVESITDTPDAIEIFMFNGTLLVVRKRGFKAEDEPRQFLATAERYLMQSRTSSNWLRSES